MLVKLAAPAVGRPVLQLNSDKNLPQVSQPVTAIGFGRTEEGGDVSESLQEVQVNVVSGDICNQQLSGRVSDAMQAGRPSYARDGYRALVSLLDAVAATEPALKKPLINLPTRGYPSGFEFLEFAVDAASKEQLTQTLSAMCFRRERRHVSKSVELWRQGAVNIVVNSENSGFAADAFATHGPTVCDMGLRVRDADAAVARATALGAPAFQQPVGTRGEIENLESRGPETGLGHLPCLPRQR